MSFPQKYKEAVCWWKYGIKWAKGKLADQNAEGICHCIAWYCQMVLQIRIGQYTWEVTCCVEAEHRCWILVFTYVHSPSHQRDFRDISAQGEDNKENKDTHWLEWCLEAMKMGADKQCVSGRVFSSWSALWLIFFFKKASWLLNSSSLKQSNVYWPSAFRSNLG